VNNCPEGCPLGGYEGIVLGCGDSRCTRVNKKGSKKMAKRSAPKVAAEPATVAVVRKWALENGFEVAAKGRIPAPVRAAFTEQTGREIV
jgi:hypothetical protein